MNAIAFSVILGAADDFLDKVVLELEGIVDPHNVRAMAQFFEKVARDNVIKNKLPKYAAGTGFANTLKALSTLSIAATEVCNTDMASSVQQMAQTQEKHTTSDENRPAAAARTTDAAHNSTTRSDHNAIADGRVGTTGAIDPVVSYRVSSD